MGQVRRDVGRRLESLGPRLRRLQIAPPLISPSPKNISVLGFHTSSGYVCQSWKCPVAKIRGKVATSPSHWLQRSGIKLVGPPIHHALCKPPMDHYPPMVGEITSTAPNSMFNSGSILGWDIMVAPINSPASQGVPSRADQSEMGDFPELPGAQHATYQMAPPLCSVIREALQRKEVSAENITSYLKNCSSLPRYDRAFRTLWAFCTLGGCDPLNMSNSEVAGWLHKLAVRKPAEARNAFAALLLIPGLESLRFSPLLKPAKKLWSGGHPKYSDFSGCLRSTS